MPRIPFDKIPQLVEQYERGKSYRELAKQHNVSHMTVKRAIDSFDPTPAPPDIFRGLQVQDKVRLRRDINFSYHYLEKGEVVQVIDFEESDQTALVTTPRYREAIDVPIDALTEYIPTAVGPKPEHSFLQLLK